MFQFTFLKNPFISADECDVYIATIQVNVRYFLNFTTELLPIVENEDEVT